MRRISIKVRQFCRDSVVRMQKWLCPSVNIWQIANHSIWHKEHQHLLWRSLLYFFIVSEEAQALYKLFITKLQQSSEEKYCLDIFSSLSEK